MDWVTRRTVRNGIIGGVVGAVLGVVPLLLFVAALIGGGVAGYLERTDGALGRETRRRRVERMGGAP